MATIAYHVDSKTGELKRCPPEPICAYVKSYTHDHWPIIIGLNIGMKYGDEYIDTNGFYAPKTMLFLCDNCNEYHYLVEPRNFYYSTSDPWKMNDRMFEDNVLHDDDHKKLEYLARHSPDPITCLKLKEVKYVFNLLDENGFLPHTMLFDSLLENYIHENFHYICRKFDDPTHIYYFLRLLRTNDYRWLRNKYGRTVYF